jgi:hypothetical protein
MEWIVRGMILVSLAGILTVLWYGARHRPLPESQTCECVCGGPDD